MSGFGTLVWVPVLSLVGVSLVAWSLAAAWRRRAPGLDARLAGTDVVARAIRDGVAVGFALVGVGTVLQAVGYLGTVRSLSAQSEAIEAGSDAPLVVLVDAVPVSDVAGAAIVGGFAFVVVALAISIGIGIRERLDALS